MDEEFAKKSAELAKIAVEKCILTEGIQYVVAPDKGGEFRVKATKRLTKDDKEFLGEILITIGPPSCREKERIALMNLKGKIPEYFVKRIGKKKTKMEDFFF